MQANTAPTAERRASGRSTYFLATAALIALLVLAQALLAGEWLAGKQTMNLHQANGGLIFLLALAQVGVVAATVKGAVRTPALVSTVAFVLLVAAQFVLGGAGFDTPNQARAFHIANGVLLAGLSIWNLALAGRG